MGGVNAHQGIGYHVVALFPETGEERRRMQHKIRTKYAGSVTKGIRSRVSKATEYQVLGMGRIFVLYDVGQRSQFLDESSCREDAI